MRTLYDTVRLVLNFWALKREGYRVMVVPIPGHDRKKERVIRNFCERALES